LKFFEIIKLFNIKTDANRRGTNRRGIRARASGKGEKRKRETGLLRDAEIVSARTKGWD